MSEPFEITRDEADKLTEAGCCVTSAGPIIMDAPRLIRAFVLALREVETAKRLAKEPTS